MIIHNDLDQARQATPADRVRWGTIVAGTFTALTTLAILSTLGAAIGLSSYDRGQDTMRNVATAGGAWGILSTIIAFALGGWVCARSSAVRGGDHGLLNGALVAAVAIPLILFMVVASAVTPLSEAEAEAQADKNRQSQVRALQEGSANGGDAVTASARIGDAGDATLAPKTEAAAADAERARQETASRTAWRTLATMLLAIAAASLAGFIGVRHDHGDDAQGSSRHGNGGIDAAEPDWGGGNLGSAGRGDRDA